MQRSTFGERAAFSFYLRIGRRLTAAEIPFQRGEERLFVEPEHAFGCMIAFEQG